PYFIKLKRVSLAAFKRLGLTSRHTKSDGLSRSPSACASGSPSPLNGDTCSARERGCVRRTSRSAPLQDLVVLRAAQLGHAATGLSGTVALRREARAKRWARLVCPSGTETRRFKS